MNSNKIINKMFLLILSVLLFVAANPNICFNKGLGFLAFIYFVPVLVLVRYCSFKDVWLFGGLYGSLSYGLYAYWLYTFDSLCLSAACIVYFIYFALVFLLLKITDKIFKKYAWVVQWLCICGFEYVKTLGFLGFNYGVTAYTQWNNTLLIQVSDLIGPYGLSAFVLFFSALITSFILKYKDKKLYDFKKQVTSVEKVQTTSMSIHIEDENSKNLFSVKSTIVLFLIWCLLLVLFLIYGKFRINENKNKDFIQIAAIQSNESPWKNGVEEQTKDIYRLMKLTDEALEINPEIKIVVWPETSVVSAIVYQYETHKDERKYNLIKLLLEYFNSKDVTFVIGNGHEVNSQKAIHDIYNSALVFTPGQNVIPPEPKIYSKIKLVPFSEYFPYKKYFPDFYHKLLKKNVHMWTPGKEYKVFQYGKFFYSTPICFEDTFPQTGRKMFKKGSRCFINLSNDSWSNSIVCQNQHLAMAVFRSVENKVPTVRSTTSGQTCIINSNGKITAICAPFSYSYVNGKVEIVPQYQNPTIYTRIGDVFGIINALLFFILLIIRMLFVIIKKSNK